VPLKEILKKAEESLKWGSLSDPNSLSKRALQKMLFFLEKRGLFLHISQSYPGLRMNCKNDIKSDNFCINSARKGFYASPMPRMGKNKYFF